MKAHCHFCLRWIAILWLWPLLVQGRWRLLENFQSGTSNQNACASHFGQMKFVNCSFVISNDPSDSSSRVLEIRESNSASANQARISAEGTWVGMDIKRDETGVLDQRIRFPSGLAANGTLRQAITHMVMCFLATYTTVGAVVRCPPQRTWISVPS